MVEQPICQGENRQAQTVCPGHQDDPNTHNDKTKDLVEVLVRIELPAAANRTAVKNSGNGFYFTKGVTAVQTLELYSICNFTGGIFLAMAAESGNGRHRD